MAYRVKLVKKVCIFGINQVKKHENMAKKISSDVVKGYMDRFPDLSSRGLARKIYGENKEMFTDEENCRNMVKYYRGQCGVAKREYILDKSRFVKGSSDRFHGYQQYLMNSGRVKKDDDFELPESFADEFVPYEIKQSRVLRLSDLHFPYQHNEAIRVAVDYGVKKDVNCILLDGDIIDFAGISRHEKDWRQRKVHEEFEAVRVFLRSLRKKFPKAKIVWKDGNHDERWEKWLFLKAPEIFDAPEFQLDVLLRFGELGIERVTDKRPIKIGKLTALHGHELAGGAGGVNPARSTFLKTLSNVIVGHYHKTSQSTETTLNGDVISVHSTGCLCGLNPNYMPINKWNLGFAYVEVDVKTGNYQLSNLKIINGKVY